MQTQWQKYVLGLLALVSITPALWGQTIPGVAPPTVPAPGVVPPAPAAPGNLFSFLCPTAAQKEEWKECFCNSPFGKIFGAMAQPVGVFSGGLIGNCCALPSAAELALPPESAGGAAARIKADEAAAAARRADVRYLGTVECNRWPEAEAALINSLRGDRNECVRWEAAMAFARGCCCSPRTVAALSLTVVASDRDGFPPERSERVRIAAGVALDHCLQCLAPHIPVPLAPPEAQVLPTPKVLPKKKEVPEDQERRAQDEVQKLTDRYIADVDRILQAKEADLMAV